MPSPEADGRFTQVPFHSVSPLLSDDVESNTFMHLLQRQLNVQNVLSETVSASSRQIGDLREQVSGVHMTCFRSKRGFENSDT